MKQDIYETTLRAIEALIEGETDVISIMSTLSCELYHGFDHFNWVGFYRRVAPNTLKVGPYQGTHGCLEIDINRGVCGRCVREAGIQVENDVRLAADHIACSSETRSEIVLPVVDRNGYVQAVLDIDSLTLNAFDDVDASYLGKICGYVSERNPDFSEADKKP